ncbi:MAG: RNA-binding S4 domain-containing protein [Bacillota bacterium]
MPEEVRIETASIKLDQFLKWADITSTGGEAKIMITSGLVRVNGQVEGRRGKNLVPGDIVNVEGRGSFVIIS